MKARNLEAVLRAAWTTVGDLAPNYSAIEAVEPLRLALTEADPHGVYKPQPPAADLEETQDIPLRDCPRMPRDPEAI